MAHEPQRDRDSLLGHEMDKLDSPPKTPAVRVGAKADVERPSVLEWWRWELVMMIVSVIAFAALVGILAAMDGEPVRNWGPLTLNSINSLLTTVMGSSIAAIVGASLSQNLWNDFGQLRTSSGLTTRPAQELQLYQDASRGPKGSMTLLWKQGPLSVAALGAIVTILHLGFATFTQQLITSDIHSTKDTSAIAKPFPRSQRYASLVMNDGGVEFGTTQYAADFSTLSTVVSAGLGNIAQPLQAQCPSQDCTYNMEIPSLAIDGSCTDVTEHLDNKGSCSWERQTCNEPQPDGTVLVGDCGAVGKPCKYKLPTGPSLTFQPGDNIDKENDLYAIWNATRLIYNGSYPTIPSIAYNDTDRQYILKFAAIGLPPSIAGPYINSSRQSEPPLPPMQAHECALWLSLNYYDLAVKNGTTTYHVTKSYTEITTAGGQLNFVDSKTGEAVSDPGHYGISNYQDTNSLIVAAGNIITYNNNYVSADWQVPSLYRFGSSHVANIGLLEGVYRHSDNLQNWTLNLAQALTNNIAAVSPAPETAQYDGTVFSTQNYFKIRWYWISLPSVVLLLSYAFLGATIFQTQRKLVQPWKSNVLVMAFADMDESVRTKVMTSSALGHPSGLQDAIGDTRVGLQGALSEGLIFSSSRDT